MVEEKSVKSLEKKISKLNSTVSILENKLDKVIKLVESSNKKLLIPSDIRKYRARTERSTEHNERNERSLNIEDIANIRGRHREIMAMLINDGFQTYKQISNKLNISQSRARAYIAELRNKYDVPIKSVRDPEGYKVGIEVRFVEQLLTSQA